MDPITLVIITTIFVLATGGATTAAVRRTRHNRRMLELHESLQARRPIGDRRLSIFDVFWDLGASDFALELMAHHGLVPDHSGEREIRAAWSQLEDLIDQHGNYDRFLEDSLEAIQEFFEEHRHTGHRRRLPGLRGASRRTIDIPKRLESDRAKVDPDESPQQPQPPTAAGMRERRELRQGGGDLGLQPEINHQEIDLDELGNLAPLDILQSVLDGRLGNRIEKWWKMRRLRQLRGDLDEALESLYQYYADTARRHPDFYEPLYDAHSRWRDEASRLRFAARHRPWEDAPFEMAADILFELAVDLAEKLASRAYHTTFHTIENIHTRARRDELAMAGYLVYLNRHAFFAGRHPCYAERARKVEYATQRVREEVLRLRDEGIVGS